MISPNAFFVNLHRKRILVLGKWENELLCGYNKNGYSVTILVYAHQRRRTLTDSILQKPHKVMKSKHYSANLKFKAST